MKRLATISLFFVLVAACGSKDKVFVPTRLLTEEEMVEIMFDVQIIEANLNQMKTCDREKGAPPVNYNLISVEHYSQLFEHYGITDSIFDQNLKYYTEHPAVLERIMDSVTLRLTKVQSVSQRDDSQ